MSKFNLLKHLIFSDLKRLRVYIPKLLIAVSILLAILGGAGKIISNNIYEKKSFTKIKIAYYLPDDTDKKYNNWGVSMLQDTESINSVATLIEVNSIEEANKLINSGDAMYFIVVPDNFFSGIMDGTNPPIKIIVKDNSSIEAYISNEVFFSFATYLGVAQAAVYSASDTMLSHNFTDAQYLTTTNTVNLVFLERALGKDSYITVADTTKEGNYTLLEHYMGTATILSLFFMAFILMPFLLGYNKGMVLSLSTYKINNFHIFISRMICTNIALFITYIPCNIILGLIFKKLNPLGIITVIPGIFIISFIISIICSLCKNIFSANMIVLFVAILIMYIGGGILPLALLPASIQSISNYLPGCLLLKLFTNSLFAL